MSIPPLWRDVGKKKWSPFLVSGPQSPCWAPEHGLFWLKSSLNLYCKHFKNGAAHTLKMVANTSKMVLHALLKWSCMHSQNDVAYTSKMVLSAPKNDLLK